MFRNVGNIQVVGKSCIYGYFPKKLRNNFPEILRKFWRYFEIILLSVLKNFSEISGRFHIFCRNFGEITRLL